MRTFYVIFLSGAAFTDLLDGKIYNSYLLLFFIASFMFKSLFSLEIFGVFVVSIFIFLSYIVGAIAGGDAKLLLMCTFIFPFKEVYLMVLTSFFIAGTAGLFIVIKRLIKSLKKAYRHKSCINDKETAESLNVDKFTRIRFAVPVFMACILCIPL